MSITMQLWEIDTEKLLPMESVSLNLEKRLEEWLINDLSLIGLDAFVIGRQVHTDYGGFIDILAMDSDGRKIIIELKRSKTPRDIVAQCLDYGSWVFSLDIGDLGIIFMDYCSKDLAESFRKIFDAQLPDEIPNEYQIIIVAETLDDSTERIVQHLNEVYSVNINAAMFNVFKKNGHEYMGRSWLKDPEDVIKKGPRKLTGFRYVNTGIDHKNDREWCLNVKYSFVSAGGGARWINAIKKLKQGDKIFAYIKGKGYAGYGIVEEEAVIVKEYLNNGKKLIDDLPANHCWREEKDSFQDEWMVKVHWVKVFDEKDAKWFSGAKAYIPVVCELRDEATFEFLKNEFGIVSE